LLCWIAAQAAPGQAAPQPGSKTAHPSTSAGNTAQIPSQGVIDFVLKHNIGPDGKPMVSEFKESKAWQISDFIGKGAVRVEGDTVFLEKGNDLTGIHWQGPLVRMNYEITLEAMRVDGDDFFCGLTFPYNDDPCSLIIGGWGGRVVGISSLDYQDAYNNETCRLMDFEKGRWYAIRLRVTPEKIEAWINDKQIVDVATAGRKIDIRIEVEKSKPLGIASWRTTGAIRNVQLHAFTDASAAPETKK